MFELKTTITFYRLKNNHLTARVNYSGRAPEGHARSFSSKVIVPLDAVLQWLKTFANYPYLEVRVLADIPMPDQVEIKVQTITRETTLASYLGQAIEVRTFRHTGGDRGR